MTNWFRFNKTVSSSTQTRERTPLRRKTFITWVSRNATLFSSAQVLTSYPKTIFLTDLQHSLLLSCLGVFDHTKEDKESDVILNHNHRDFSVDNSLKVPYKTVHNAYEAVQYVFKKEGLIS